MLNTSQGLTGIVNSIVGIINTIIPVLVSAALVFLFVGIFKYVRSEGKKDYRMAILWSLVAIFVLLSVGGLLRLMCSTLLGGSCNNTPGANHAPYDSFRG